MARHRVAHHRHEARSGPRRHDGCAHFITTDTRRKCHYRRRSPVAVRRPNPPPRRRSRRNHRSQTAAGSFCALQSPIYRLSQRRSPHSRTNRLPLNRHRPPAASHRGFLPCWLSVAGPGRADRTVIGRRPKPFATAAGSRPAEEGSVKGRLRMSECRRAEVRSGGLSGPPCDRG